MSGDSGQIQEAARREAVDWLLRVDAADVTEAEWLAFHAWLGGAPENLQAFETADRIVAEMANAGPELLRALDQAKVVPFVVPVRRRSSPWTRYWPAASGLAAAAAALVVVVALRSPPPAPTEAFQTAKGESRLLDLADGSHVRLNSASRLTVRLEKKARYLELAEGEAAFDVAKDANRPFLIAAGERDIRVVGTEFDVLRHDGLLRVTVRRGVVAVQAPADAPGVEPVLLKIGDQYERQAGSHTATLRRVDPDAAFAWRDGELIYRDQPLAQVVADLNRYYATPVKIDDAGANLRFSGVLKLDAEADVVRRLQGFLHLAVTHGADGYSLQTLPAAR